VRAGTLAGLVAGLTGSTILWVFFEWVSSVSEYQIDRVGFLLQHLLMLSIGAAIGTLGGSGGDLGKKRSDLSRKVGVRRERLE